MKYSIGILTTITLLASFVLSSCDRPSHNIEDAEVSVIEANRDLEIAKSEVEAELQIYRVENENRIMGYNRSIEEIKQRINNETDLEVRARLETKLDRYEVSQRQLRRELDNYEVSGRENWDRFKASFNSRMDVHGDSLNNFFSTSRTTSAAN